MKTLAKQKDAKIRFAEKNAGKLLEGIRHVWESIRKAEHVIFFSRVLVYFCFLDFYFLIS